MSKNIYPMSLTVTYSQNYLIEADSPEEAEVLLDEAFENDVIDPYNAKITCGFVPLDALSDKEKACVVTRDPVAGRMVDIDLRDTLMEDIKSAKNAEFRLGDLSAVLHSVADQARAAQEGHCAENKVSERSENVR